MFRETWQFFRSALHIVFLFFTGFSHCYGKTDGKFRRFFSLSTCLIFFYSKYSQCLTAKSVNGSVKLHLPHDLADASIHASTTTGKIRLVSNGRTESYTKTFTRSGISAFIIQASTVNGNVLLSDLPAEN